MLDESIKLPSDEESNLTSQISENEKTENLTQEENSSVNVVNDEVENDEVLKEEESNLISENSDVKESDTLAKEEVPSPNIAVDEIETKIAESSEKIKHVAIEMIDYENLNLEDLVAELDKLVKEHPVQSIHNNVNTIKNIFFIFMFYYFR